MSAYTYTGEDDRYYPALGLEAKPGVSADFDEPPTDGRWQLGSAPSVEPVPEPSAEPVAHPLP
jgi:hypothetical protein